MYPVLYIRVFITHDVHKNERNDVHEQQGKGYFEQIVYGTICEPESFI